MLEYNETRNKPISYVYQFNSEFIRDFLDWLYLERECSERTVNNYRGWCSSLAEWMIERHYLDTNPVANINKLRAKPKKRKDLSKEMLTTLFDYLNRTDKYLLLACMFEYYTFIRPTELSYIQLKDINVSKHTVFVPATVSKNKRDANVGLNDTIIKLMLDLKVFEHPADHYLFSKDLMPGWRRVDPDIFNKRWASMRKKLGWDANVKFYSLKDSGIRDLANARGIVIARDQARHTDVSTTNKYLQGHDMRIHNETTTFVGALAPDED
jgi:integrase